MVDVSIDTLQNWEQEPGQPQGHALAFLTMFKNNPKASFDYFTFALTIAPSRYGVTS